MKRKVSKHIQIGSEEIAIRPGGAVEARNCSDEFLGVVSPKTLDRIIATAEAVKVAAGTRVSDVGGEWNVEYHSPDEADPATIEISVSGQLWLDAKDLQSVLKQPGKMVVIGRKVDRKTVKNILTQLQTLSLGPAKLILGQDAHTIDYLEDGTVDFDGDRNYELADLKRIQKISQLMRNGKRKSAK
jgi:hypothetical protein